MEKVEEMEKVLICTVGGSHAPIVESIRSEQPDFVFFICSEDTALTKGSYVQVTGKGKVIKSKRDLDKPDLPNIPEQVGLDDSHFEVLRTPADSLDRTFVQVERAITEAKEKGAESIVVDYTGGTKSMSAGAVMAALEHDVRLKLMTNERSNLHQITDYSSSRNAAIMLVRFNRARRQALRHWEDYGYAAAARSLETIRDVPDSEPEASLRFELARTLSRAFQAWDVFNHKAASELLSHDRLKSLLSQLGWINYALVAQKLASVKPEDGKPKGDKQEALLIEDLWLNAQRCAHQGRFDDAVARVYRFIEWVAQWLLKQRHDLSASEVPCHRLPETLKHLCDESEQTAKLGLMDAWNLLAALDEDARKFWKENGSHIRNALKVRNHSILAHGIQPVDDSGWQHFYTLVDEVVRPFFLEQAKKLEVKDLDKLRQLPVDWRQLEKLKIN